ncbi:family 43 glycosylhydrolase [Luxibacter massiliensis]|uniref:family 43 glycosylhydrolase n=1 Tax=Luxibacter massiliensis TaxID=2219695 RepID=UPI000F051A71|nr:family 43 glycosylhydrolase [Luxibacter massiliensis]
MHHLYYQPENACFGDCMPYGLGSEFYLFHQRDRRNPAPLPDCEPFGWDLITTNDFVHYQDYGTVIGCGQKDEQDQFIFAGSIFKAKGEYHAFYTGYNRDYPARGLPSQVLMHAKSPDLIHWDKSGESLTFGPQKGYDPTDWRDPFVLWNEERQEYLLILGARKEGDKHCLSGCTVYFTSQNLAEWKFGGDFWAPGLYTMHEMPDLFKMGDWWYLLTTEYSQKCKTIYRMSRSLDGPWQKPADDAFDGRAYYAARTFALNGHRILFGWVPTRASESDTSDFVWGGTYMAHELYQLPDGTLKVKVPETVWAAFKDKKRIPPIYLDARSCQIHKIISENPGNLYSFEGDFIFTEGMQQFGITMRDHYETGQYYQFTFLISENRFCFEKVPNWPWPAIQNTGLERPISLTAGAPLHIRLIVDDTIATLYVNGTALNARMYAQPGKSLGITASGTALKIENATFSNCLKK